MFSAEDYKKGFNDGVAYATKKQAADDHKAYWIGKKFDKTHYNYYCAHCNYRSKYIKSRFCPGCGYTMVEKTEGEKDDEI